MASSEKPRRVRVSPRMTARALGEYADGASARRRESIIREQKFPSTFMTTYYRDATNIIRAALRAEDVGQKLRDGATLLAMKPALKPYDAEVKSACLDAVEAFARVYSCLPLQGWTAMPGKEFAIAIEAVPISVQPIALLARRVGGRITTGALFLVFRKRPPMRDNEGTIIAELVRQALYADGRREILGKMCLVVDVFSGRVFDAPRANTRLSAELRSACREIVDRWNTVNH